MSGFKDLSSMDIDPLSQHLLNQFFNISDDYVLTPEDTQQLKDIDKVNERRQLLEMIIKEIVDKISFLTDEVLNELKENLQQHQAKLSSEEIDHILSQITLEHAIKGMNAPFTLDSNFELKES